MSDVQCLLLKIGQYALVPLQDAKIMEPKFRLIDLEGTVKPDVV